MPPPPTPPATMSSSEATEVKRAVDAAMAAAEAAMADSTAPEDVAGLLADMRLEMATAEAEVLEAAATPEPTPDDARPARPRYVGGSGPQRFPVVDDGYGASGDGFPAQTTVHGTIVAAGSLRLCRAGRPPVSRWLKIRLSGTPSDYPPVYMIVAVECHEDKEERLVGRSVRMEAWKSTPDNPIRMATDDVPDVDAPMYVSYPGNVILGG